MVTATHFQSLRSFSQFSVTYLHNLSQGQEIMEKAMKTHIGNPVFINNYAYALTLDGKIEEAERVISKIKKLIYHQQALRIYALRRPKA